jgi:hypothetical protein
MITTLEQVEEGLVRRATVTRGPVGWRYQEQRDSLVIREVTYTDWHRVERALLIFERGGRHAHSTKR